MEPANATDKSVSWSSDNESIAIVDADGMVTAVAVGIATITVTTTDGEFTADCEVVVDVVDEENQRFLEIMHGIGVIRLILRIVICMTMGSGGIMGHMRLAQRLQMSWAYMI